MAEEEKEKVLSQAEIDALVMAMEKQRASMPEPPPAPTIRSEPPPRVQNPVTTPSMPEKKLSSIADVSSDNSNSFEETLKKLEQLEQKIEIIWKVLGLSQEQNQPIKSEIDTLKKYIHEIIQHISRDTGCNILKNFQCDNCHSVNLVAIKTMCTKCGKENWIGWWPS